MDISKHHGSNSYCTSQDSSSWTASQSLQGSAPAASLGVDLEEVDAEYCMHDHFLKALAGVIRQRRLSLQITQQTLAEATGLDRSYLISIEHGKRNPSITKLAQIAKSLKLSTAELVGMAEWAIDHRD